MSKPGSSKTQERYEYLKELHFLLCSEMTALQEDFRRQQEELAYLRAYIRWKHLEDEYRYFAQNAYEVRREDLPFPHLTL